MKEQAIKCPRCGVVRKMSELCPEEKSAPRKITKGMPFTLRKDREQLQGFECTQNESWQTLDDCDCSDAEDCPVYKKAIGVNQVDERYRDLVEFVEKFANKENWGPVDVSIFKSSARVILQRMPKFKK